MTNPVATPTTTARRKATHQFQPQSSTHLARSRADSVPIWACARFKKRLDL